MKNYRPIFRLPVVSKIIENVIHTQFEILTLNKLFISHQYGYRVNRSTEIAALALMDRNIDNMNKNLTPPIAKNTTNILQIYYKVSQIYPKSTTKVLQNSTKM